MLDPKVIRVIKGITILGTVCGSIVAVGPAWLALGLPILSTHSHVQTYVSNEISKVETKVTEVSKEIKRAGRQGIEIQTELVDLRRNAIDKEIFEIDMFLNRQDIDIAFRGNLTIRKRALEDDRKNFDYKYDQLQRQMTGRRP